MPPPPTVCLDVSGLSADTASLDALARLVLRLRRCGYEIRLRHPSPELLGLIELAGLRHALGVEVTAAAAAARTAETAARCRGRRSAP